MFVKKYIKQIVQWGIALAFGMGIVSVLTFWYNRPVGWLERSQNATSAVWEPNSTIYNFVEGAGITRVDSRGYVNPPNRELAEDLVLCIGASFTQAKEVWEDDKYTALLNEWLAKDDSSLKVYNLSRDAYFYPEIVAGFRAAIEEFPQTGTAVLEICNTEFTLKELESALDERAYSESQLGSELLGQLSPVKRLTVKIKDYFPILSILKHQASQLGGTEPAIEIGESLKEDVSEEEYALALDATMKQLRNAFEGKIIILFHPAAATLKEDGTMELGTTKYYDIFEEKCQENDIRFVDVSEDFLSAYKEDYIVPYGFNNTTLGVGHLNEDGHRIIAEKLFAMTSGEENK